MQRLNREPGGATATLPSRYADGSVRLSKGNAVCVPAAIDGESYEGDLNALAFTFTSMPMSLRKSSLSASSRLWRMRAVPVTVEVDLAGGRWATIARPIDGAMDTVDAGALPLSPDTRLA